MPISFIQVQVTKEMEGMEIQLPSATRNMFVDGECGNDVTKYVGELT
jgi:hypothetical protein